MCATFAARKTLQVLLTPSLVVSDVLSEETVEELAAGDFAARDLVLACSDFAAHDLVLEW